MEHKQAFDIACAVRAALLPGCKRLCIAGSVRRGKPDVKDIELVAELRTGGNLFDDTALDTQALTAEIDRAIKNGLVIFDPDLKRNGEKYKRLKHVESGMVIDLFIADSNNWGNIYAIRTGNGEFSEKLVTQRNEGGLMPVGMKQKDGYLYRYDELVPCPTEAAFFMAIAGIEPPLPELRGPTQIDAIRKGLGLA